MKNEDNEFYGAIEWILILLIGAVALTWLNSCTVNRYYVVVQPIRERIIERQADPVWNDWGISRGSGIQLYEDGDLFDIAIDTSTIADEWIIISEETIKKECNHMCFSAAFHEPSDKCCMCGKKIQP